MKNPPTPTHKERKKNVNLPTNYKCYHFAESKTEYQIMHR